METDTHTKAADEDLSMEEILQSIRKIIAEEGEPPEGKPAMQPPKAAVTSGSDILELTDMVLEPDDAGDVLASIDSMFASAPTQPEEKPEVAKPEVREPEVEKPKPEIKEPPRPASIPEDYATDDSLLSATVARETADALKRLPKDINPRFTTPSPQFRSGTTVEDLVVEALRPMLKDWLDKNLPITVERIVEREIRRLNELG